MKMTRAVALGLLSIGLSLAGCVGVDRTPASVTADKGEARARAVESAERVVPIRISESGVPLVNIKDNPRFGSPKAKIGLIEFSDYQCAFCRNFHRQQFEQLKKAYIDPGVVLFIHKDLPQRNHLHAIPAATAAHCAGAQARFWDMHAVLFENQERLHQNLYPVLARQLGLDEAKFRNCLQERPFGGHIARDAHAARILGLTGTPAFLIGRIEGDTLTVMRQALGAPSFEDFAREIEKLR